MEEIENVNPWDYFKSIQLVTTMKNDPLFSCVITLYILVLLYFPHRFSFKILFSPVLVLTASLLLSLLRLGAVQRIETESVEKIREFEDEKSETCKKEIDVIMPRLETESVEKITEPEDEKSETCKKEIDVIMPRFEQNFVEWDVSAPLEVIYEEYEEGEDPKPIERYPSLSLYYPESDSDSSSSSSEMDFPTIGEWVSSEKMGYKWEDEDREELIEIELEDDNLIEIDIS